MLLGGAAHEVANFTWVMVADWLASLKEAEHLTFVFMVHWGAQHNLAWAVQLLAWDPRTQRRFQASLGNRAFSPGCWCVSC